jgi:hypothetical protein
VIEIIGAGEGNRTLVFSLEGCCSTIELHPRNQILSSMSNPNLARFWHDFQQNRLLVWSQPSHRNPVDQSQSVTPPLNLGNLLND